MVQRDQVPEEVTDIQRWIQDEYTLENANYVNTGVMPSTDGIPPHLRVHNNGLQPDNDLVPQKADGQAFIKNDGLAANETFTSEWYDSDGWRTVEAFIKSDVESAREGFEIQFSRDIQATNPTVDASKTRTYANEAVDEEQRTFDFGTKLDGFRVKYTNGDQATFSDFALIATLREPSTPDSADYVKTDSIGDSFITVGTDPALKGVGLAEPTSLFSDLQTIERRTVIDATSTFGTSILRDEIDSTGSGSIVQNPAPEGEIELGTGTTANSSIELQTAEYGRYTPGFSAQAGMGVRIPTLPTEGEIRWGYFTSSNGFYFGYDGGQQELFIARRKDGSETERVYRSDFNRQDMDERLNRAWEPNEGDIFQIDFSWYGYGIIIFSIVTQTVDDNLDGTPRQISVPIHALSVKNESSTSDPNQPINIEMENAGSGEDIRAYIGGRQFSVFGEPPAEQRITSETNAGVSVGSAGWTHIMTWRRDPNETANSKLNINSFDTIQTEKTRFALVVDANISSTTFGDPSLTNSDETLLEVSTAGSFDGIGTGTKVFETIAPAGSGNQGAGASSDVNARLGQENTLTLIARTTTGNNETADATMRMSEDW